MISLRLITLVFPLLSAHAGPPEPADLGDPQLQQLSDLMNNFAQHASVDDFARSADVFRVPSPEIDPALAKCDPRGAFSPKSLETPSKDGPLVRSLCNLLTPNNRVVGPHVSDYTESCEFIRYTPCVIDFQKNVEFKFEAVLYKSVAKFEDALAYALERGAVFVHCELVPITDLEPRWVCGVGTGYIWWHSKAWHAEGGNLLVLTKRDHNPQLRGQDYWEGFKNYQYNHNPLLLKDFLKATGLPQ